MQGCKTVLLLSPVNTKAYIKSRRLLPLLMVITLAGLAVFLAYWLKQNYEKERRLLAIRTDLAFRQEIMKLQASQLRLDGLNRRDSTGGPSVKIFMADGDFVSAGQSIPRREMISTINVIRDKILDSAQGTGKSRMVISMNKSTGLQLERDSLHVVAPPFPETGGRDQVVSFLYGVDSLQDSLRVVQIDSACRQALLKDKISIPFRVLRSDSAARQREPVLNEMTVGFARPLTYRFEAGNTFPYLLRRLAQPLLISVLLLGFTVVSFLLLYRSLLKQRRLAELKNEFISNITHELKTPIATVGVAIEALKNFNALQDPARTREYLDISAHELQRLSLLVDKVLKLSMFEKKEVELNYEPLDLQELVNEVVASLRLQLEKRKARIDVQAAGDTCLQADRLHLLSVIFNLLDNAIKYSPGEPIIRVELRGGPGTVEVSVSDAGIGIPPEYRDKVFDKFFRVPHGDTHNAKGYGLGLSYVAQVVRKHGGQIQVAESDGPGTRIEFFLPKSPLS